MDLPDGWTFDGEDFHLAKGRDETTVTTDGDGNMLAMFDTPLDPHTHSVSVPVAIVRAWLEQVDLHNLASAMCEGCVTPDMLAPDDHDSSENGNPPSTAENTGIT